MIRYVGFTKAYGAHLAVDDLSLSIHTGEIVALLGPNGSGKTTCLKAAAGLVRPTRGAVVIGTDSRPAADPAAREAISFLPQRVSFPDALTGREALDFYRALRGSRAARVDEALALAGLNGAGGRAVGTYSGGMVQRLGLAVATLPDAPVLILDEPTAALDPDGLLAFHSLAAQRRDQGQTVLFTSHQLGDAERLADRFAVLVHGRLTASFVAAELRERLSALGAMRLRLGIPAANVLEVARRAAPAATASGDELIVPGTGTRAAVIERIRAAGVEIQGITADEGRLDALYRELVDPGR
jgi:Cu-processing system ATP-binding protein